MNLNVAIWLYRLPPVRTPNACEYVPIVFVGYTVESAPYDEVLDKLQATHGLSDLERRMIAKSFQCEITIQDQPSPDEIGWIHKYEKNGYVFISRLLQ